MGARTRLGAFPWLILSYTVVLVQGGPSRLERHLHSAHYQWQIKRGHVLLTWWLTHHGEDLRKFCKSNHLDPNRMAHAKDRHTWVSLEDDFISWACSYTFADEAGDLGDEDEADANEE